MEYINIHKFNTLQECESAIDTINIGEGIPVSNDSITTTYTKPIEGEDFWYIIADNITEKYVADTVTMTLKED